MVLLAVLDADVDNPMFIFYAKPNLAWETKLALKGFSDDMSGCR